MVRFLSFFIIGLITVLGSCKPKATSVLFKNTPSNASFIAEINTSSIIGKTLNLSSVFDKEYIRIIKENNLQDVFLVSGIDLNKTVIVFGQYSKKNLCVLFETTNTNLFYTYASQWLKPTDSFTEKGIKYGFTGNKLLATAPNLGLLMISDNGTDTKNLILEAQKIINLPIDSSVAVKPPNAFFEGAINNEDARFWFDLNSAKSFATRKAKRVASVFSLLEQTYINGRISFEKQNAIINGHVITLNPLTEKYSPVFATQAPTLPIASPDKPFEHFMAVSVKVENEPLGLLLKDYKILTFLNKFLFFVGLSFEDYKSIFDGSMQIAIDNSITKSDVGGKFTRFFENSYLTIGVKDKKMYNGFIKMLSSQEILESKNNGQYYTFLSENFNVINKPEALFFTASPTKRNRILSGQSLTQNPDNQKATENQFLTASVSSAFFDYAIYKIDSAKSFTTIPYFRGAKIDLQLKNNKEISFNGSLVAKNTDNNILMEVIKLIGNNKSVLQKWQQNVSIADTIQ